MNRKYNLKLDLQFRCNNSIMKFNQFDNNTSDFFIKISNGGKSFDVEKAIVVLAVIKPSGKVASQFIEVKNGLVYVDLKPNMKDEIGTYTAQAMLILEDERVVTDSISYEVEEDKIFSLLNDTVEDTEDFTLLTDMLNRLSTIEISEEQRVINEAERILSEENRKIEESKRVEAELIRQHEEADRTKYDAIRESNENIRKQNESIRLANETNRVNEEAKRVEEEANRVEAEQLRKDNYNFMTEDEERRRLEANAHKEAENLRAQAENTRVNEEAKRRTTEQARVLAENTRVSNENTRKANEETRQNNETHRVEAETQRQNRYNSFIADAEVNANNFENYTNSAKVKEEERKSNELNRKSQEDRRVSNEVERISNENARKANEVAREKNETSRQNIFENKVDEVDKKIVEINTTKDNFVSNINTKVDTKISEIDNVKDNFVSSINTKVDTKISEIEVAKSDMTNTVSNKVNEVENRFNALTSKQQQDAEVIDARDGETSLKARLDRDIEKAKQVYVNVEGSHISTDSSVGYLKDIEIFGNTIQDSENLSDIRSVGDKVEGQELYEIPVLTIGKNLVNNESYIENMCLDNNGNIVSNSGASVTPFIEVKKGCIYKISDDGVWGNDIWMARCGLYDSNKKFIHFVTSNFTPLSDGYVVITIFKNKEPKNRTVQLEEGTVATPYEPYIEDKLTILSPVQLEKVGNVADRLIEKDGVWGVEKNIGTIKFSEWNDIAKGNSSIDGLATYHIRNIKGLVTGSLTDIINTKLPVSTSQGNERMYKLSNANEVVCHVNSDIDTIDKFKEYMKGNLFKYIINSTFIPLPHDQQIKLRTFANKTNISFGCEIEGTIKAQVPKSLGATVNTHTEQISNLNKELDRVKKLEESTVSIVTTESDFTTVEATSNGYFEDVKLEGKTLVNLWDINSIGKSGETVVKNNRITVTTTSNIYSNFFYEQKSKFKPSTEYTIIVDVYKNTLQSNDNVFITSNSGKSPASRDIFAINGGTQFIIKGGTVGRFVRKRTTISDFSEVTYSMRSFVANNSQTEGGELELVITVLEGDHTKNSPSYFEGLKSVGDGVDEIVVSSVNSDETQSDKKQLLYYNNETQAWEKPILREWDSIEKHSDGKYYYHKRSGTKVLNGSENWNNDTNSSTMSPATYRQSIQFDAIDIPSASFNTKTSPNIISDLLPTVIFGDVYSYNHIGISISGTDSIGTHIIINNNFIDVTELKQWLQANNLTLVYQLAQEKVYECTNIDLITYNGETNFIVESGVLSPKTTLKVHNNISNVVSLLQKKVSLLENNITSYMITQNRLMLASRYNADTVSFKVDVATLRNSFEYDNDLYELILNNILVGKDNYNREYIENLIIFYWMDFVISDEMHSTLFEIIEEQHNPKVIEEETPLI